MFGIFLGLACLMFLAFKGWSIIWAAPISAMIVAVTGGLNVLDAYTGPYMQGFVSFTVAWFPVFMLGAIFGKLMEHTGMAKSVAVAISKSIGAKRAILAVVTACAVLTYGGISLFVVVFAVYPIAVNLFREANLPRRLIPGTIALGAFGFTMTAVPGSPQIQNLIPGQHFGTPPTSAPITGLLASAFMFSVGIAWLKWRENKLRAAGETFDEPKNLAAIDENSLPNALLCILPLVAVVVIFNVTFSDLGNAAILPALLAGIVLIMLLNLKSYKKFVSIINEGAVGSLIAIINTSAAVGFGFVVQQVAGFQDFTRLLMDIPGNPLVSLAISVTSLAGATGSASGGMGIALTALADQYIVLAEIYNISLEAMHRVAAIASGGLDTLPHNGAVLTLLAVTGLSHKDSYFDIFMTSVVAAVATAAFAIIITSMGIL